MFYSIFRRIFSDSHGEAVEASFFFDYNGTFDVDRTWTQRLEAKLKRKFAVVPTATIDSNATRLSINIKYAGRASQRQLDRLVERIVSAVDWYIFWNSKGVKINKPESVPDYKDRVLGVLAYDEGIEAWHTEFESLEDSTDKIHPFCDCSLYVIGKDKNRPPKYLLSIAHMLIENGVALDIACKEAISDELLEVYNTTGWRGENAEIDSEAFIAKMRPSSLFIDEDGEHLSYEFEEDLFSGHEATVLTKSGEIMEVGLQG